MIDLFVLIFITGAAIAVYFLPFLIAVGRKKSNLIAILLLNLFLGWTFLGWIVALIWAFNKPGEKIVYVKQVIEEKNSDD